MQNDLENAERGTLQRRMLKVDIFIIQCVYSWRGKLEINHGMSQVGSDLEISCGPTFCHKGILREIKWHPVLIQ